MKNIIRNTHEEVLQVAPTTGIYIYKSRNTAIYIGKAVNLKARLLSHEQNAKQDNKEAQIVGGADHIELIYTPSEFSALLLEASLISKHKPKFNVRWKDDKSPLYIKITVSDLYPKVSLSRKENDRKSKYFGPFSSTHSAESLIRELRKILPFCTQKKISRSACFYSKIGQCSPCPSEIVKMNDVEKKIQKSKYRANIRALIKVLSGEGETLITQIRSKIRKLSKLRQFEDAIKVRDMLARLEFLILHGKIEDDIADFEDKSAKSQKELLSMLTPFFPDLLNLDRIECYDNSTLNFEDSVSSMVVFENGRSNNQEYRRFKLDPKTAISDFNMMKEVVTRRLNNKQWKRPSLIIIDGGKPQMRAVIKVMTALSVSIPIIGIAKHPDRIIVGIESLPTLAPNRNNLGFRLIQYARDEAHRFAKKYHVHLRSQKAVLQY